MRTTETILEIVSERGRKKKPLQRLYRLLGNPNLLLTAYGKIAQNQGITTPGTDLEDKIDGMSLERIYDLSAQLRAGTFHWKPTRRTYIRKANGDKRPLSLPGFTDKLVQEAMRILLEAYYEPRFSQHSHGFRPGRSCHTALRQLQYTCRSTKWWIEGDIKGCFDNIDHTILENILAQDIQDHRFLKLVRQMLKAGYMEDWRFHQTYSGTPQGGIISPLLANIYLHQFDDFMEDLVKEYRTSNRTRKYNPAYNCLSQLIAQARQRGDKQEATRLAKAKRKLPVRDAMDPFIRVRFCRYADDFIVSVIGPKATAIEIKQRMSTFLKEQLNLTLSPNKTLITHHTRKAHFLGFNITIYSNNDHVEKDALGRIKRNRAGIVGLEVPRSVQVKWIRKYSRKRKPCAQVHLISQHPHNIITAYGSELRGLYQYYKPAHNVAARFYPIKWVMNQSLCKTLAEKYKTTVRKIVKQFRYEGAAVGLGYVTKREGKESLYATFGTHAMKRQPFSATKDIDQKRIAYRPRTQLVDRMLANQCEICGSKQHIEVHHIRAMKDVSGNKAGWQQLMSAMRRKTLVVCRLCHNKIHNGQYDGMKLTKLA
ncbi:MAG: group II intron reverse transcriptase/maturase [Anaerolineales bacterium]|nr:group II intron reverse transcriptase/maturase [Anaerolineales bacterium]